MVDDIGMLPSGRAAAEAFYRPSTPPTSAAPGGHQQHPPSGYDTIMPKTLATAAVEFLHHAHVIITEGTSLRLAEATTGRG